MNWKIADSLDPYFCDESHPARSVKSLLTPARIVRNDIVSNCQIFCNC